MEPKEALNLFTGLEAFHAGDFVGRQREVPEDHDDAPGGRGPLGRRPSQVRTRTSR